MIAMCLRRWAPLGLLAWLALACWTAAAEDAKAPGAAGKADAELAAAWEKVVPRLEYERLPLSEVAQDLRRMFPKVNFIVPQSAGDAEVGHVTLSSVTLADILKAIELASEGRIVASVAGGGPGGFPPGMGGAVDPLTGAPVAPSRSNMVHFVHQPNLGVPGAPSPIECRAFNLTRYLRGRTGAARDAAIKSLEEAITLALGMLQQADSQVERPQFSIHAETSLFIAVGRVKELGVVAQIINEMQNAPMMVQPPHGSSNPPEAGKER